MANKYEVVVQPPVGEKMEIDVNNYSLSQSNLNIGKGEGNPDPKVEIPSTIINDYSLSKCGEGDLGTGAPGQVNDYSLSKLGKGLG